jgi:tetratricopeptide (TPR) repeat protein
MARRRAVLAAGLAVPAIAHAARADQTDPRLDPLFERLAAARDAAEARLVEQAIWMIWHEIDEAVSAQLLELGAVAMANGEVAAARDAFDRLIERSPGFAEGWNKRATLLWLTGDHAGSVRDIQRTLALEPRHFGALSGLGLILMAEDAVPAAIRAFEAGLRLHPFLPGARQHLEQLRARRGGDPT